MRDRKISFFACMWQSATNFQFYKEVLPQPFAASVKYLFVLALIATVFISSKYNYTMYGEVNRMADWALKMIPAISIDGGKAVVDAPEPLKIEEGNSAIIIDTTGDTAFLDNKYSSGLLLGKENIYLRLNSFKERDVRLNRVDLFILGCSLAAALVKPDAIEHGVLEISKIKNFIFDRDHVEKWKKKILIVGSVVFPIFYFIYFILSKLIQAAFFSFVVVFSNKALKDAGINYEKILNLCIYALTPVTILTVGINLSGLIIPYIDFVYFFMYVAFLLGAISQCMPRPRRIVEDKKSNDWDDFI